MNISRKTIISFLGSYSVSSMITGCGSLYLMHIGYNQVITTLILSFAPAIAFVIALILMLFYDLLKRMLKIIPSLFKKLGRLSLSFFMQILLAMSEVAMENISKLRKVWNEEREKRKVRKEIKQQGNAS
ncbi:hypothetical protein B4U37_21695 (plasmid) [Sutcliffiella horikoshii]|uniref:Lipoprotein n=1 Tax=Sutcliffiella horikoshii TaxID=79883 RepID=A0ABM6KR18_9BACI|nr:hypothetical protein [Sutcliffiella horikoshii]ART78728.1 hypothetical protein B4U37_21695 [Sutcliffiella horikoshii]